MKWIFVAASILAISGCTTMLSQQGADVSPITPNEKNSSCQSLGIIVTQAKLGPQKQLSAMNMAMNEVAARGGNRILLMTSSTDWAEGSSVTAEALRCNP